MNILMSVLWFNEPGDGWTYFKEEAVRLARAGHDITVICPKDGQPFQGPENVRVYRCRSFHLIERGFIVEPVSYLRMVSKLLKEAPSPDVIYEDTSGAYPMSLIPKLYFRLKGRRVPMVVGIHGQLREMQGRGAPGVVAEVFLRSVPRFAYRLADAVLISGENCRERIAELGAPRSKVRVMPFGVRHNGAAHDDARKELGIAEDEFVVGTVGRPTKAKGVDTLIKAFNLAALPKSRLLIVGDDGGIASMKRLASPDAVFTGYRKDVPRMLRSMDVFGNLSLSEGGISGAQIEAMAAGLPSLVTPFAGGMEDAALVVGFGEVEQAAGALRTLHQSADLRSRLGAGGRRKAAEMLSTYSWDVYVEKMDALFKELVA